MEAKVPSFPMKLSNPLNFQNPRLSLSSASAKKLWLADQTGRNHIPLAALNPLLIEQALFFVR